MRDLFGGWVLPAPHLMAEELPPVRWVIPEILPEGVTLFAGKVKMGKSWMALGAAIAVATGGVALGTKRVEQGEALYLALEDNKRRLQRRIGKLLPSGAAPPGLHLALDWPRADEGGVELLNDWVAIHPDCLLVVIDTLARFKPRATGRRTQYDEDRDAVDPLAPIAADHNVAIVLVHHLRETESDDPLDMIHGSAGLTGGVDGALVLKRKRGDADAYLTIEGRDIENPTELALKFDPNAATWAIMGDAEEYRLSEGRRAIMEVLRSADEPMGPSEITDLVNDKGIKMSYGAVREMLSQMVKDGQVKNLGRGSYVLAGGSQNHADIPDILTNGKGDVSLSGMSGHFRRQDHAGPDGRVPLSFDLQSGSTAPLAELERRRCKVREVLDNPDFFQGAAKARADYLEDPESAERFERLCRAVCTAADIEAGLWREVAGSVRAEVGRGERRSP